MDCRKIANHSPSCWRRLNTDRWSVFGRRQQRWGVYRCLAHRDKSHEPDVLAVTLPGNALLPATRGWLRGSRATPRLGTWSQVVELPIRRFWRQQATRRDGGGRHCLWLCGLDFWVSRNGAGAGFWDCGFRALRDRLGKTAKVYSSVDMHVGDDNKLYIFGLEDFTESTEKE